MKMFVVSVQQSSSGRRKLLDNLSPIVCIYKKGSYGIFTVIHHFFFPPYSRCCRPPTPALIMTTSRWRMLLDQPSRTFSTTENFVLRREKKSHSFARHDDTAQNAPAPNIGRKEEVPAAAKLVIFYIIVDKEVCNNLRSNTVFGASSSWSWPAPAITGECYTLLWCQMFVSR